MVVHVTKTMDASNVVLLEFFQLPNQVDFRWIPKLTTVIESGYDNGLPELQHYCLGSRFE